MRYWRQLLLLIIVIGLAPVARSQAPVTYRVPLTGMVRDAETGAPIAGARLSIADTEVVSGDDGVFPATNIVIVTPIDEADVVVTAEGYHLWSFEGVALRADQPLEFRVRLRRLAPGEPPDELVVIEPTPTLPAPVPAEPVPTIATVLPEPTLPVPSPTAPAPRQPSRPGRRAIQSVPEPPEFISIGMTGSSACVYDTAFLERVPVVRVRFVDYVRDVLPNEWIAVWPAASLEAGAVAAKQFAWYNAFVRQKWRRYGYPFDLLDSTCDQVYKPGTAHPATDAAIATTWPLVLTRNGTIFETGYRAYDRQCPATGNCMGQWGSKYRADVGHSSTQILLAYYVGAMIEQSGPDLCAPADDAMLAPEAVNPGQYRVYLPLVVHCG